MQAGADAPEAERDETLGFLIHEVANAISQGYSRVSPRGAITRLYP